jgi:uncharacterized OB-fold protein
MTTEAESRPFNAASFYAFLKEGRFMGVRCRENGNIYAEARPIDPVSHSRDMEWHELSGRATLTTFTCISVAPASLEAKGYGRNNPYCTGIVTLEEGPRISARISGVDAANPQNIPSDLPVVLALDEIDADDPGLVFRPA